MLFGHKKHWFSHKQKRSMGLPKVVDDLVCSQKKKILFIFPSKWGSNRNGIETSNVCMCYAFSVAATPLLVGVRVSVSQMCQCKALPLFLLQFSKVVHHMPSFSHASKENPQAKQCIEWKLHLGSVKRKRIGGTQKILRGKWNLDLDSHSKFPCK